MDRPQLLAIVVVMLFVLLAMMYVGWRARKRRQGDIPAPQHPPEELGTALGAFDGKYVATSMAGNPLDRIAVHGLGFRGNASVVVADSGVLLQIAGTDEIWLPATHLVELRRATWTIDRVVEEDGLHVIEWKLGDRVVDSYFRMAQPRAFQKAVESIITHRGDTGSGRRAS